MDGAFSNVCGKLRLGTDGGSVDATLTSVGPALVFVTKEMTETSFLIILECLLPRLINWLLYFKKLF